MLTLAVVRRVGKEEEGGAAVDGGVRRDSLGSGYGIHDLIPGPGKHSCRTPPAGRCYFLGLAFPGAAVGRGATDDV